MRSHFGLRGLSVLAIYGALVSGLPAPLNTQSAVETLDRAQHDCLRKYGISSLTKIKKIFLLSVSGVWELNDRA